MHRWLRFSLLSLIGAHAFSVSAQPIDYPGVPVAIAVGLEDDGTVLSDWIDAIRVFHTDKSLEDVLQRHHALTDAETRWASLIQSRAGAWSAATDSLQLPFAGVRPPDTVYVTLGNVGGQDAFTYSDSAIGFDLRRLQEVYGEASTSENVQRIDRFFAHEFTHLMHKAWREANAISLVSALDRALWECLVEGIGNYRSLSRKWMTEAGNLTAHAHEVLSRLEPIFVERIAALDRASDDEAAVLMENLSMGPFDQKWGALTVALWLAQESKGDDRRLRKWVEAGPRGVLSLAKMYLPKDLVGRLPRE